MREEEEKDVLTLCVVTAGGSKRAILSCPARTTTVAQLQEQARTALGLSSEDPQQLQLHVDAFPKPRRTLISDMYDQSLHAVGICHQDRILVTVESCPTSVTSNVSTTKSSPASTTSQRQRRKAAIAATESFSATLKKDEESALQNRVGKSRTTPARPRANTAQHYFRKLEEMGNSPTGRQLRDGSTVPSKRSRKSSSSSSIATTDIVEGLVASTRTSSGARLMREGWYYLVTEKRWGVSCLTGSFKRRFTMKRKPRIPARFCLKP
jgi:hypothetical protein